MHGFILIENTFQDLKINNDGVAQGVEIRSGFAFNIHFSMHVSNTSRENANA